MPLKTEAECTVVSETLNLSNIGYRKEYKQGDTVFLPNHVANEMADQGAVTIVTLGSEHS